MYVCMYVSNGKERLDERKFDTCNTIDDQLFIHDKKSNSFEEEKKTTFYFLFICVRILILLDTDVIRYA